MKKIIVLLTAAAVLVLFTGCDVWFFLEGGGDPSPGIYVYANYSSQGSVDSDKYLYARVYQENASGDFLLEATEQGQQGAEVLDVLFEGLNTDTYKVIVWYDSQKDQTPQTGGAGEVGYTSPSFFFRDSDRVEVVVEDGDWGTITDP
jgi:hypothetical protein